MVFVHLCVQTCTRFAVQVHTVASSLSDLTGQDDMGWGSRRRSVKRATVSASALALHLDCSRTYIGKLEAEGVLHRAPDGSGLDVDRKRPAMERVMEQSFT